MLERRYNLQELCAVSFPKKRFHVISLPHTAVDAVYSWCAYTQKVRRFADMMSSLGHECVVYGGDEYGGAAFEKDHTKQTEPPCWDQNHVFWAEMATNVLNKIKSSLKDGDFVCLISGVQQWIVNRMKSVCRGIKFHVVEFGIGYSSYTPTNFCVFESYSWMNAVYSQGGASVANGRSMDIVIPNSYDEKEIEFSENVGNYILFVGRCIVRKGLLAAAKLAAKMKIPLKIAGAETKEIQMARLKNLPNVEYLGIVTDVKKKSRLFGEALATIVLTKYIGPFEGVHVEAQFAGCPVLTTDWGVFIETVQNGFNGFRASTEEDWEKYLGELISWKDSPDYMEKRKKIREHAVKNYSTAVVRHLYDSYFEKIAKGEVKQNDGFFFDA